MTDSPSYLAPLGARRDPHAPRVDLRDVRPTEHVPRGVGPSRLMTYTSKRRSFEERICTVLFQKGVLKHKKHQVSTHRGSTRWQQPAPPPYRGERGGVGDKLDALAHLLELLPRL